MQKVAVINDDGSTQDFFPQSYTDAAVQQAIDTQAPANAVSPDVSEVDLVLTDRSTRSSSQHKSGTK
jgi:hypothetical protein